MKRIAERSVCKSYKSEVWEATMMMQRHAGVSYVFACNEWLRKTWFLIQMCYWRRRLMQTTCTTKIQRNLCAFFIGQWLYVDDEDWSTFQNAYKTNSLFENKYRAFELTLENGVNERQRPIKATANLVIFSFRASTLHALPYPYKNVTKSSSHFCFLPFDVNKLSAKECAVILILSTNCRRPPSFIYRMYRNMLAPRRPLFKHSH